METKTYSIPERNYFTFKKEIERLNKRANKLGCAPIVVKQLGVRDETFQRDPLTDKELVSPMVVRFYDVEVQGDAPKYNGWKFLCTIQHTEEGNILLTTPSASHVENKYRDCLPWCDHCKLLRRRNDTFIVEHEESKEQKQVGSSCIRDFLGHDSPDKVASIAELFFGFVSLCGDAERLDWDGGSDGPYRFPLASFLPYVVYSIKEKGYVSRKKEKEEEGVISTATLAWNLFHPPVGTGDRVVITDKETALAEAARDYVLTSLENVERNDFEYNLYTVAKLASIECRNTGIASYIVQYYLRHLEQEEANKVKTLGGYVGTVGERLRDLKLKMVKLHSFENMYGVQWVNKLVDADGNWFTWITGTCSFEIGEEVMLDGTVKAHEEYKGLKSTLLSRCKVKTAKQAEIA